MFHFPLVKIWDHHPIKTTIHKLVGGFNPSEKYARQKDYFPKIEVEIRKMKLVNRNPPKKNIYTPCKFNSSPWKFTGPQKEDGSSSFAIIFQW